MNASLRPWFALGLALLAAAAGADPARAEEGEATWSLGVGTLIWSAQLEESSVTRYAPVLELAGRYALDDFWELGGVFSGGVAVGADAPLEGVGHGFAEVRYVIDALRVVPYIAAGAGAWLRTVGPDGYGPEPAEDAGPRVNVTVHGGFGVDYRPDREWSVGLVARYHAPVTDLDHTVGLFDVAFTVSLHR